MTQDGGLQVRRDADVLHRCVLVGRCVAAARPGTSRLASSRPWRCGDYERQDRGIEAVPYLTSSPPGSADNGAAAICSCPRILTEVGSMSLEAESELLASDAGTSGGRRASSTASRAYLADRPLAARFDALVPAVTAGARRPRCPAAARPSGRRSAPSDGALRRAPDQHRELGLAGRGCGSSQVGRRRHAVPCLRAGRARAARCGRSPRSQPGESVELPVTLPAPAGAGRQVAWITLDGPDGTPLTASGSPALQLGNAGP